MALGGAALIAGGATFALKDIRAICDEPECPLEHPAAEPVGKGLMIGGAVVMAIGLVILPVRLVARMRYAQSSGAAWVTQNALRPWLTLGSRDRGGRGIGLAHTWTF